MSARELAQAHRLSLLRTQGAAVNQVRDLWRAPGTAGWNETDYVRETIPQVVATLTLAQMRAAEQADSYLDALERDDEDARDPIPEPIRSVPAGTPRVIRRREGPRINARGFAGTAADGRSLASLAAGPAIRVRQRLRAGVSMADALASGELLLSAIASTETMDAGRTADGAALTARSGMFGYVRMLTPPSCARCVILAGRWYGWNEGFQRHPNCDCVHVPISEDTLDDVRTDPRQAVLAGNVVGLSAADRRAIEMGADPSQVINARRGTYTADGYRSTTEGTTRRGFANQRFREQTGRRMRQRLRPEAIYRIAGDDRDEAIRLLYLHGYLL